MYRKAFVITVAVATVLSTLIFIANVRGDPCRIVSLQEQDGKDSFGSGVSILKDDKGHQLVLTNKHVVKDTANGQFNCIFTDGTSVVGKLLATSIDVDLAVILIDTSNTTIKSTKISNKVPQPGDQIHINALSILHAPLRYNFRVTKYYGASQADDNFMIGVSGRVVEGDSGSMIINDTGELVGLINSTDGGESYGVSLFGIMKFLNKFVTFEKAKQQDYDIELTQCQNGQCQNPYNQPRFVNPYNQNPYNQNPYNQPNQRGNVPQYVVPTQDGTIEPLTNNQNNNQSSGSSNQNDLDSKIINLKTLIDDNKSDFQTKLEDIGNKIKVFDDLKQAVDTHSLDIPKLAKDVKSLRDQNQTDQTGILDTFGSFKTKIADLKTVQDTIVNDKLPLINNIKVQVDSIIKDKIPVLEDLNSKVPILEAGLKALSLNPAVPSLGAIAIANAPTPVGWVALGLAGLLTYNSFKKKINITSVIPSQVTSPPCSFDKNQLLQEILSNIKTNIDSLKQPAQVITKTIQGKPIVGPPLPQVEHTDTQYVPYEVSLFEDAYSKAKEQVVKKYPGAVDMMNSLDSMVKQYYNASK